MKLFEITTAACKHSPCFVVANNFSHAEKSFLFEHPQAVIEQMTFKSDHVMVAQKEGGVK